MKLTICKTEYALLLSFVLFYLTNELHTGNEAKLNSNENDVTERLLNFLKTTPGTNFCSCSEGERRAICESISIAKIKLWASISTSSELENIVYIPSETSPDNLYECEQTKFHYYSETDHLFMITCPDYEVDIELADGVSEHQYKGSFKVAQGDEKNSGYVFQSTTDDPDYLTPKYYVTGLNYE